MISKTKIGNRLKRKTNTELAEALLAAKKNNGWMKVAQKISGSSKRYYSVNLDEIDSKTKEGDTIVIVGKVLGSGEISKKIKICALGFSESALQKLKSAKAETSLIFDEINKNPKAEGIKIWSN